MKLSRLLKFGPKIFTHKLTGVGIILTRKCNLSCRYCNVVKKNNNNELSIDQWKKVIDKFVYNKGE